MTDTIAYPPLPEPAAHMHPNDICLFAAGIDINAPAYPAAFQSHGGSSASLFTAQQMREYRDAPAWQPIEAAPKDGTMIMLWVAAVRYGETDDGQQYQEDVSDIHFGSWRRFPDGSGCVECYSWPDCDSWDATHWMPLPAAPIEQATGEKP